jgi:hypothetical protein
MTKSTVDVIVSNVAVWIKEGWKLKCDGTYAETRFRVLAKRTIPFKLTGVVHSTTGSRDVRISGSNAGCTMFQGSVKSTGYRLHHFPLHFPSHASLCSITFQLESTKLCTLFFSSDFIIVVLTVHFKSDNCSEKLLKYTVREVGGYVERKITSSSYSLQFCRPCVLFQSH